MIRSGRFSETMAAMASNPFASIFTEGGLLGLVTKKTFTAGSASLSSSACGNCQPISGSAFTGTSTS